MTPFVPIAMFGLFPLVLCLFVVMPPHRAVLFGYIGGWLFLPMATYQMSDIPDYTKYAACALPVLAGSLLFGWREMRSLRFRIIDVPMIVFCLWPFVSAINAGYTPIAGLSRVLTHLYVWGIPYTVGRAYFRDRRRLRELAIGIFVGGVVYLPLVWYEIRMSPQLHTMVYGWFQHGFGQHIRYGGFRPIVFMQQGLMVALWMATSSLTGLWLWRGKVVTSCLGVPMALLVPAMIITTVFCKSGNGWAALGAGLLVYAATRLLRSPVPLIVLAIIPSAYITLRTTQLWSGRSVAEAASSLDEQRGGSLNARMYQEDVYVAQAMERPLMGWSGGGFIPRDQEGKPLTRGNDSFWIITFGMYGLVSLVSIYLAFLLPTLVLVSRVPPGSLVSPIAVPASALAVAVSLFAIDSLMNGMVNPVYALAIGGLSGLRPLRTLSGPAIEKGVTERSPASRAQSAELTAMHDTI